MDEERSVAAAKNSAGVKGEQKKERRIKLLKARGWAKLGQVASGYATRGLWLGNRKVRSHVVGEEESQLSERETVGEVSGRERWGKRSSDRTRERVHRFKRER